jgi:Xaa-Pro aminopeptidase
VYITLLRDPVKRLISNYFFARSLPHHKQHDNAIRLSLEEFVQDPLQNQAVTRALYGFTFDPTSPIPPADILSLPPNALQVAKQHLSENYAVVGITEQFDASLMLMKKVLNWGNVTYMSRNITKTDDTRQKLSPEVISTVRQACAMDVEVYHHALSVFEAQKQAYGLDALQHDLDQFHRQNRIAGRVLRATDSLRQTRLYRAIRRLLK